MNRYASPAIPNLRAATGDAQAIFELMSSPNLGQFDVRETSLLVDDQASKRAIEGCLEELGRVALEEDEVWIYFAGHGTHDGERHLLLPHDAQPGRPRSTGVELAEWLRCLRCKRQVVFLDCCHSGAIASFRGDTRSTCSADQLLNSYPGGGLVVFCSSDTHEKSYEYPHEQRGLFTHWLIEGLRGKADQDRDGLVTWAELWPFLHSNVRQAARSHFHGHQTPRIKTMASDFCLMDLRSSTLRDREATTPVPSRPPASQRPAAIVAVGEFTGRVSHRVLDCAVYLADQTKFRSAQARLCAVETAGALSEVFARSARHWLLVSAVSACFLWYPEIRSFTYQGREIDAFWWMLLVTSSIGTLAAWSRSTDATTSIRKSKDLHEAGILPLILRLRRIIDSIAIAAAWSPLGLLYGYAWLKAMPIDDAEADLFASAALVVNDLSASLRGQVVQWGG